ncbi:hypothetical protein Pla8534_60890 [Lignipirellula cremea]|uniref:Uncharacterized protein n=1 Tax=Lignipirellula cremea TaxID=2528010 RepID=A0A518E2A8_9BACT|nr:hypothetical protein Pla8534_60890 [Lignipirellula cremea]
MGKRLQSLDAYRGLIMITLAFGGFGLAKTAKNFHELYPEASYWESIQYQFSHAEWVGCSYWDLIQPSFMFMVGVSLAWSFGKRRDQGDSYPRMLLHAAARSLILVGLSIFLMSQWSSATDWEFTNVLGQIGLGYFFLFLLWGWPFRVQAIALGVILLSTWIAFEAYPGAGIDPQQGAPEVGVKAEWAQEHLQGVRPAWHKNANIAHAIDRTFLNWFPREKPWLFSRGGYATISFWPSLATMLLGLMAGELLRSNRPEKTKLLLLLAAGAAGLLLGYLLNLSGICPMVKRIWTPSWAFFSTGWCLLILGALYGIVDILGFRRWTFPLVVVGANSILIYCMSISLKPYTEKQIRTHLGQDVFSLYGWPSTETAAAISPMVESIAVGLAFWLVCYYCYRHKIFIRI